MKLTLLTASFLLLALACCHSTAAQTLREYQKVANKKMAEGDSVGALGIYRQAFDQVDQLLDARARFEMAEIAKGLRYYTVAKEQYAKIAESDQAVNYPDIRFRLADAQRRTGAYAAASSNYNRIISTAQDSSLIKQAMEGLQDTEWALSRMTRMDSIELIKLPATINTNNSEFAGVYANSEFYFSRLELLDYKDLKAGTTSSVFTLSDPMLDSVLSRVELGPQQYIAHFALNEAQTTAYFTVCDNIGIADFRCDIYSTSFGDSLIGKTPATKLEAPINLPGFSQTNPTLGRDEISGDELLIFSSNRLGGEGKMDLWMSRLSKDGRPDAPINLGFANTPEDDVTPFFHTASQALFFSSKGHETLGGFDVHRVEYNAGNWGEVVALRAPINSSFDDTYYSLTNNPARTYISSNRPGTTCEAKEIQECCGFDLYMVDIQIALEVLTFDEFDSTALAQTTVVLYDQAAGTEISRFTDASNLAEFPVEIGLNYRLIASRPEYGNDTLDFDTKNIYQPTLIQKKMYLPPMLQLEVYTYNSISRQPLNGVRVEFQQLGTRDTIISFSPSQSMYSYSVEFGKTYRAKGSRPGFSPDMNLIPTASFKGPGRIIRDTLYLAPFSPLPLVLYFDNDYPNPRSREMTTTLAYGETVDPYLAKELEFMRLGAAKNGSVSREEMASFFDEVEQNYNSLLSFSTTLVKYLQEGNEIDIVIEGYASPLAKTDYNKVLTSRRTRSLINHFTQWQSGALLPFLQTGQLRIRQEPLGEEEAPAGISDNPAQRSESVYGIRASKQRKVRLIDIQRRDELPLSQFPSRNPIESQSNSR